MYALSGILINTKVCAQPSLTMLAQLWCSGVGAWGLSKMLSFQIKAHPGIESSFGPYSVGGLSCIAVAATVPCFAEAMCNLKAIKHQPASEFYERTP